MSESHEHLQTLTEIRSLMERSSKFLSLSGLSGISAGVVALLGAGVAYARLQNNNLSLMSYERITRLNGAARQDMVNFLILDGAIVLIAAVLLGILFTVRKARRQKHGVWNSISKRLLWALSIPLVTGGIFCLALIRFNLIWLTFPTTLIFYGMALYSGSKFTVRDVEYLGLSEILLGLVALFWTGYSLLTWAVGFGVLHIVYGTVMYLKYERDEPKR
jgi:predicted lysophospholipase L1 biosynthesis ABC-type transport system permease subunit